MSVPTTPTNEQSNANVNIEETTAPQSGVSNNFRESSANGENSRQFPPNEILKKERIHKTYAIW
jgi:hypothetical protein